MTNKNDCKNRRETIAALVLGELQAPAADEIKKHIDSCENCRLFHKALTEEEEAIQSAFRAIDDRGKAAADRLIDQYEKDLHKSSSRTVALHQLWHGLKMPRRAAELAAAASIIMGVFIGIHLFGGSNVAWAQVVEKFSSVPFFSASIYIKEDGATSEPKQMELWMSRDGRSRLRVGKQVIFAEDGEVIRAFDITSRSQIEPDEMAVFFLQRIGEADELSLDSVIRVMFRGEMQEVTPLINPSAVISQDMVVFDVDIPHTPEWVRIWALRESRLPVRVKVWDPRDGDSTDAIFEYSKEQADEFFDPNAFENLTQSGQAVSRVNLAYAFLKDPGGRQITPEDMFARSGYHVPQVRRVGITPEGAVWVTAGQGRNRTPGGNVFHGFSRIEDDLGRTYFSVGGGHRLKGDVSYDIFVPIDFPFDERKPAEITLFCEVEDHNPNTEPELIGSVDVTEWEQGAAFPNIIGPNYADALSLKISLAYKLFGTEHAERLNRLVRTMPDWNEEPRNKSLLLFHIRLTYKQKDYEEVIKIGEALAKRIFENPRRESRYSFREYLIALARMGRIDEAAELFRKIDAIEEMSPEKSDERYYPRFVKYTAEFLTGEAGLEPGQISRILGFDISKRQDYKSIMETAKRKAANREAQEAAEKRRKEIAEYYMSHPLPGRMELLERPDDGGIYLIGVPNTVPGHADYKFLPINYKIRGLVSSLLWHSNVQPYELVPMRVEAEEAEQELFADLIYRDGIGPGERAEFVLNSFGMELAIEPGETRKVLVARYDGRPLKNYKDVKAPFGHDGKNQSRVGTTSASAMAGFSMPSLLSNLAYHQNKGIEDDDKKLVIVDETGIEGSVSTEMAFWPGEEGLRLAKKWFEENFGVTFTEETQTMPTYVIRKRTQ
jgi:tetratricopeptide (TPR) repeat protein